MRKDETPGTIILTNINDGKLEKISLQRLEIDESERQLGVIIPADGSFQQEYKVRLSQSKDLGKRIYRAPLSHYESFLVYKLYFIPKIKYPLSLTQFSLKECNEIQSHFY